MINKNGTYRARATEVLLAESAEKGTPSVQVNFRVTDGEFNGQSARWDGWLTEATAERTIESLQYCGWEGDDLGEFSDRQLHGIDRNEIDAVVEMEPYTGTEEKYKGKSFPRVRWVNKAGGRGLNVDNAMDAAKAAAFGDRFKGLVHKVRQTKPTPASSDTDFPHGANESPAAATGTGGKRF